MLKKIAIGVVGVFVLILVLGTLFGEDEDSGLIAEAEITKVISLGSNEVHFCELEWDFSEYLSRMGHGVMVYTVWKGWYVAQTGKHVVAGPKVTEAARDIFAAYHDRDIPQLLDLVPAAVDACVAEGYIRPSATR